MKALLLALLRAYQYLLSPWIGGSYRYWPTCSEYSREAIGVGGSCWRCSAGFNFWAGIRSSR